MTSSTAPKLSFWQKATLEVADKARRKAAKHGVIPLHKIYKMKDVALLEAHGWKVHTYRPASYVTAESWIMVPA